MAKKSKNSLMMLWEVRGEIKNAQEELNKAVEYYKTKYGTEPVIIFLSRDYPEVETPCEHKRVTMAKGLIYVGYVTEP